MKKVMRKTIYVVATIFLFAVVFTACKETKKDEVKEEVKTESSDVHEHDLDEMASMEVYQCPMDCEKGKSYEAKGSCPVCKMDLKVKETEMQHADVCKCKEGGECKCEGGKCECNAELVSNAKECTKCEPGKCKCKA